MMNTGNLEKIKRLIAFRERQRDIEAKEMEAARRKEADAETERQMAERMLDNELNVIREATGKSLQPAELALAVQSAKWAQIELKNKERQLAQKKQETESQRSKLLASHQKVKQMETLHQNRKEEHDRNQQLTQQAELDDLASVREVNR